MFRYRSGTAFLTTGIGRHFHNPAQRPGLQVKSGQHRQRPQNVCEPHDGVTSPLHQGTRLPVWQGSPIHIQFSKSRYSTSPGCRYNSITIETGKSRGRRPKFRVKFLEQFFQGPKAGAKSGVEIRDFDGLYQFRNRSKTKKTHGWATTSPLQSTIRVSSVLICGDSLFQRSSAAKILLIRIKHKEQQ